MSFAVVWSRIWSRRQRVHSGEWFQDQAGPEYRRQKLPVRIALASKNPTVVRLLTPCLVMKPYGIQKLISCFAVHNCRFWKSHNCSRIVRLGGAFTLRRHIPNCNTTCCVVSARSRDLGKKLGPLARACAKGPRYLVLPTGFEPVLPP